MASTDLAMESSEKGIRAVKISLVLLTLTAAFQVVVVIVSGSVALLADTIHNFSDALTALPLWLAFALSRRPASRRFTHGLGRSEDLAGVIIVLIILASALVAGYESYRRILDPTPLSNIEWVIAAAIIGFIGNEVVAVFRMRVGKEIGSAALVADGQHARVDGLTSLAVLFGAIGVLLGAPIADPLVGSAITIAILFITKDAAVMVWHRLMDGVDPRLTHELEHAAEEAASQYAGAEEVNSSFAAHRANREVQGRRDDGHVKPVQVPTSDQCQAGVPHLVECSAHLVRIDVR
jgi:cation diffusion facilitator family transporter